MCDPGTALIMGGSALASGLLQKKAADAVESKRNRVLDRTYADLDKYRDTASQALQRSVQSAGADQIQAGLPEATAKRAEKYTENFSQEDLLPGSMSGSDAAKQAIVKSLAEAVANSTADATRRAAVDSYNDVLFGRDVAMNRAGQDIKRQANFAGGRAGVAELELADAERAGEKYANLAGLVGAVGKIAPGAAGFGAGQGWWGGYDPATGITWNSGRV